MDDLQARLAYRVKLTTDGKLTLKPWKAHSAAMAAGNTDRLWSLENVVAKMDGLAPAHK